MPRIKITETDLTNNLAYDATETIVYIPGLDGTPAPEEEEEAEEGQTAKSKTGQIKLYRTLGEFISDITPYKWEQAEEIEYTKTPDEGSKTQKYTIKKDEIDKSYILAYELLRRNIPVLYEVIGSPNVDDEKEDFTDGVYKGVIAKLTSTENDIWAKLGDKYTYNIKFVTTGGYPILWDTSYTGNASILENILNMVAKRGDATFLIDTPYTLQTATEVKEEITRILNTGTSSSIITADNLKFGAVFYPWVRIDKLTINGSNITNVEVPASFIYLLAFAYSTQTNEEWLPIAGVRRGITDTEITYKPLVEIGGLEAETLQPAGSTFTDSSNTAIQADGYAINPICNITPYGYVIWGDRTLAKVEGSLKASNFLNIRILTNNLKKQIFFACKTYTFEQNSDILWFNFTNSFKPLLDRMASGNGIEAYRVTRVTSNQIAELKAKVRIYPIEPVEFFDIEVELADRNVDLTEVE